MTFTCESCGDTVVSGDRRCDWCHTKRVVKDVREAVQEKLDEIDRLSQVITIGASYQGEMKAYQTVLHILEKL